MTPRKIFILTVAILLGFAFTYAIELSEGYHTLKVIITLISPVSPGYSMDWLMEYSKWDYKYDGYTAITISLLLFMAGWLVYRFLPARDTRLLQIGFAVVLLNAAVNIIASILTLISIKPAAWFIAGSLIAGRCLWMFICYKALQAMRLWSAVDITHQRNNKEGELQEINAFTTDRFIHLIADICIIYSLIGYVHHLPLNIPFINKLFLRYHISYRLWPFFIYFPTARVVYYLAFEYLLAITPGKLITGAYVVKQNGGSISFLQACGRTLARLIPFNAISFLMDGWHDLLSKSKVVKRRQEKYAIIWLLAIIAVLMAGQFIGNKLVRVLYNHEKAVNEKEIKKLQYAAIKEEIKQLDTTCYFWVKHLNPSVDYENRNVYKVAAIEADSISFHVYNTNDFFQKKNNYDKLIISKQVLDEYFSGFEIWIKGIQLGDKKRRHIIQSVSYNGGPDITVHPVLKDWDQPGWLYMRLHVQNPKTGKIKMFLKEGQAIEKDGNFSKRKHPGDDAHVHLDINFKRSNKGVFSSYFVVNTTDGYQYKFLVTNIPETNDERGYTQINRVYE